MISIGGDAGSNRKVQYENVVCARDRTVIPELVRQAGHFRMNRFRKDLRLVSPAPQDGLDAERLITDGVAVAKCRQHLVNPHGQPPSTGPLPPALEDPSRS